MRFLLDEGPAITPVSRGKSDRAECDSVIPVWEMISFVTLRGAEIHAGLFKAPRYPERPGLHIVLPRLFDVALIKSGAPAF
jgi:hypothetical protein